MITMMVMTTMISMSENPLDRSAEPLATVASFARPGLHDVVTPIAIPGPAHAQSDEVEYPIVETELMGTRCSRKRSRSSAGSLPVVTGGEGGFRTQTQSSGASADEPGSGSRTRKLAPFFES